jgi:hypothetical protein
MRKTVAGIVITFTMLTGCHKRVTLTINNPTVSDLVVDIHPQDEQKFSQADISAGTLPKSGGTATKSFTVPKKGGYEVTATLPASAQVFDQSFSVLGDTDPVTKTINLSIGPATIPTTGDNLKGLFGKLGDDRGFVPHDLGNALNTIVGGLIVFAPVSGSQTEPEIRFQLTPAQFSSVMDLNGFPFVGADDAADDEVKKDDTTDLASSVPIYGSLSAHFEVGSLYKVHSELKGYGAINKPEAANWNLEDALEKLSSAQKKGICAAMKDDTATMLYINEVYALQLANFNYQKGQTIAMGAKADGASVISGNTAYSFASSEIKNFSVQAVALNFNGIKKAYAQLPCVAWTAAGHINATGEPIEEPGHNPGNEAHVDRVRTRAGLPNSLVPKLNLLPAREN